MDPLPLGPTGHSPLHIRLTIPNLPPSPPEDADQGLPPPLKMPPLHDKHAWSQYHRAIDRARRIQPDPHRPTHSHAHGPPSPAASSNTPTQTTTNHPRPWGTCSMTSGMRSNNWRPSSTQTPPKPAARYTTAGHR